MEDWTGTRRLHQACGWDRDQGEFAGAESLEERGVGRWPATVPGVLADAGGSVVDAVEPADPRAVAADADDATAGGGPARSNGTEQSKQRVKELVHDMPSSNLALDKRVIVVKLLGKAAKHHLGWTRDRVDLRSGRPNSFGGVLSAPAVDASLLRDCTARAW